MTTFLDILKKYRTQFFSERDKGARFERLMQRFLQTDPLYCNRFRNVWQWGEFPFRNDFSGKDTGIDLVAETREGEYWAIQCKCYAENAHPQEKLKIWEYERDVWLNAHPQPWSDDEEAEYAEKFRNKIDECLDAGYGSCILRIKECREIVENTLKYFDGERYKIYAFVVMLNHVHVLFEPLGAFKIAEILHSWKRFSSQKLNEFLGKSGALWQKESWERYIRNQKHFNQTLAYIIKNSPSLAFVRAEEALCDRLWGDSGIWGSG